MREDESPALAREARYHEAVLHFRDPASSPLELNAAGRIQGASWRAR
jgi:hypothetical protein